MKLYIPSLTLNFNDLISSQSVSPKSFYTLRNFGTDRHFTNKLSLDNDFITLYKHIPNKLRIEADANLNLSYSPMVICVNLDLKDPNLIRLNKDVYVYKKTIYIDNVSVLFFNEEDMRETISKALVAKEVKLKNLNVSIINKKRKQVDYNIENLKKLTQTMNNYTIEETIETDNFIDKIKGIYYYNLYNDCKFLFNDKEDEDKHEIYLKYDELQKFIGTKKIKFKNEIINELNKNLIKNKIKNETIRNSVVDVKNVKKIYIPKSNSFNFETRKDEVIFNLIMNELINNQKGREKYFQLESLKEILIKIGNKINYYFKDESIYINDLKLIYSKFINQNINIKLTDITNIVMKNFYISILKYDNIEEMNLVIEKQKIGNSYMAYSFVGCINGFNSCSRIINDKIDKYNNCIKFPNEINYVIDKLYYNLCEDVLYKKDIYELLSQIKKEDKIFKLINETKKIPNSNYSFKNYGNYFKIEITKAQYVFRIFLYRKINKNIYTKFLKSIENMSLSKNILKGKYSYFRYAKVIDSKEYKLDFNDEKYFKQILSETMNIIK